MPGRFYSVPFANPAGTAGSSVTAAIDAWEIVNAATKCLILHEIVFGQYSDPGDAQAEQLSVIIKRGITNTAGSGGSAVTPTKHQTGDAAAAFTAKVGNTTQATSAGGSLTSVRAEPWNVQAGYQYAPPPEQRLTFAPSESIVVSITVPSDALTYEGVMVLEEIG